MKRTPTSKSRRDHGIRNGYRSGLEEGIAASLAARGVPVCFEEDVIVYTDPRPKKYTPDFRLPNGIYIETKGYFKAEDRSKHLLVKQSRPALDIRFVFQRPHTRLSKTSSTTYAKWAEKNGFKWAEKDIPLAWIQEEAKCPRS